MTEKKMLRVLMRPEQFESLQRMADLYGVETVSEYVRMMADHFERHRPMVIKEPSTNLRYRRHASSDREPA